MPGSGSEADQDIPAQILLRTLQGVEGIEAQLDELFLRYSEREDLPGIALLLRACLVFTSSLKQQLIEDSRKVRGSDYAGPDNKRERERAESNDRAIRMDRRVDAAVRGLRRFEALLQARLDLLSETHGPTFDALSGPYTRMAKALPGERDIELIFRPMPGTAYEIWFKVLDELQELAAERFGEEMKNVFEQMPRLMVIEYPWHYEQDTFMHAVIAHEVSHIAFANNHRAYTQRWLEIAQEHGVDKERAQRFRRWFVEFACDVLACRMIGPAYGIALVEHMLSRNEWFEPRATRGETTHPPFPTRVAFFKDAALDYFRDVALDRPTHRAALAASKAVTEEWLAKLPPDDGVPSDIRPVIEAALEALTAEGVLGDAKYPIETFQRELGPVWDALSAGVAPAEIVYQRDGPLRDEGDRTLRSAWSEPADWRSILNGGYLRWLYERRTKEAPDLLRRGRAINEERLERCVHIRGAIELSELHRAMLLRREELAGLEISSAP